MEIEIPEVPEEVLATVQVTQIAIVDEVKNEVMEMEQQLEDNTARGVVNQEGSDDVDKFKAVQEAVVVKEPNPRRKKTRSSRQWSSRQNSRRHVGSDEVAQQ